MLLKVYDFIKSALWYLVDFIYGIIDTVLKTIKEINALDIINSLSDNTIFQKMYTGMIAIAVTLLALFIVWKFLNKILEPDGEPSIQQIVMEAVKCSCLVLMSTFLFTQVSSFSITLSNYTGNLFESNSNMTMSDSMLTMFIGYNEDYKKSEKFKEDKTIPELVKSKAFRNNSMYLDKYVSKSKIIFSDKDYKYEVNWIMGILCGGFFLYSLFFSAIMLGRRQIEFLFLFSIAHIIFATSICNKQRRGAVVEQLASLVLQSSVIMLIVGLTAMIMQQINTTTFVANSFQDILIKCLLYLGCATFMMTGSQTISRFIGANVSVAGGREQLMSLMSYGKLAKAGAIAGGATVLGGGLLAGGMAVKGAKYAKNSALTKAGVIFGTYGGNSSNENPSRMQHMANAFGSKMYNMGQRGFQRTQSKQNSASSSMMNAGMDSINNAIHTVLPRRGYNASHYRRRKNMI